MRRIRPASDLPVACLLLAGLAAALPASAAGLTADDLVRMKRLSDPQLSPDGRYVAYTLRETDMEDNRGRTDLWLLDLRRDAPARRITTHEAGDSQPRWSPDGGHLYFLSSRGDTPQVWRLSMRGGDALPVTELPVAVDGFALSPAGNAIAVALEVFPECGVNFECTAERLEKQDDAPTGVVYERLFIRHWDRWKDGRRSRLFAFALDDEGMPEGEPVLVSDTLDADVPSKPFGGMEEVAFTPDGRHLIFAARVAGAAEAWSTNLDLYRAPVAGGRPHNLTADNAATDTRPIVSRDGRRLAWLAMSRPGFEADRLRIMLGDADGGSARELAPDWDRSPGSIAFSADGASVYAVANEIGTRALFSIDIETGRVLKMTNTGWVGEVAAGADGVYFTWDSLAAPADLYRIASLGADAEQLTNVNRERLAKIEFGEFEQFSFLGWSDATVHGFVMKPAGAKEGERYPVAFLIHGGPQGSFGDHFHYRWNPQTYAGAGYAVVFIDFHGSTGYGQAFTDSISGDWGGKPLVDLQKGLEAALERYPWLDGERVCALGASYGGYMINWIAGNWAERFRCLVNHDGLFDLRMMYYTTEELWFPEWEFGGPYHAVPENYERHNPANHVDAWRTPMLVIHGALDYRVPETQGIATFTALQRRGIESEFLYYPDENHWVLKPRNSLQWHGKVLGWLERYLR